MRHAKMCALGDVNAFGLIQCDSLPMASSRGTTLLSQDTTVKRDGAFTVLSVE